MKNISKLHTGIVLLTTLIFAGCSNTYQGNAPQETAEGLDLKHESRSTLAYKKPGVDFAEYDKVQIAPSTVAFKKNWKRDYNRGAASLSTQVREKDVIRIKESVAELLDEVFLEEFTRDNGYPIVKQATEGTLLIRPAIINLDVHAPDIATSTRRTTFTNDSGSATLYLELYDAVSGEILARVLDSQVAGDRGYYQWSNRVTNRADAKRIIRSWAKTLRTKFDETHQGSKK